MGIYDRDYYRREGPRYLDALIPTGQVCNWLIAINVLVFFIQFATVPPMDINGDGLGPFTTLLRFDPVKVLDGEVWRLLTAAFLHASFWHLFMNMLFLWWFGSEVERMYGSKEFLTFYLVSAVVASLAGLGYYLIRHDPSPGLGASAAVTAVLVLFACHFPTQLIYVFFVLPVPIWLFVVYQIAQDALGLMGHPHPYSRAAAATADIGAAIFAYGYFKRQWHLLGWWQSLWSWKTTRVRPRLRLYRPESEGEAVPVATASAVHLDEHLEAKLDAVLEKVARFGQQSLTEAERQILLKASEIYKRKRT